MVQGYLHTLSKGSLDLPPVCLHAILWYLTGPHVNLLYPLLNSLLSNSEDKPAGALQGRWR